MANINLLPVEYREKEKFNIRRVLIILFFILLIFGTAFLYFSLESRIELKEHQLSSMKIELAAIEKIIKEVKDLEKDKKVLEERIKVIEGLIANQSRLSRILGEFSYSILDEVWIDNISFSANQTFDFTANTFNNYLIAKYMVTLVTDPTFGNVELGYIKKIKIKEEDKDVDIVNFRLTGVFIPKKEE